LAASARAETPEKALTKKCDHNIPATLKGAGPCNIVSQRKKRNGQPSWWCLTHALEAAAPDGTRTPSCPGAWFDAIPVDRQLELEIGSGQFSVWGALPPAISIGCVPSAPGGVHVHLRADDSSEKCVDASFDIVRLRTPDGPVVTVETMAAQAYAISELSGRETKVLTCPKPACGFQHIDELKFAATPHVKHQCNGCGASFWDRAPSVGNPLAEAFERLGLSRPPDPVIVDRRLVLTSTDFACIALWPSNRAIVTNIGRPEDAGIHVHAWDAMGAQVLDDTYSPVTLDGHLLDCGALRMLAVQRAVGHGPAIRSLACEACGLSMLSPLTGWVEPTTQHQCQGCGAQTSTRRKAMLNPLAENW